MANQGPPPPSPMVMERFQSVISQLFLQRVIRIGGAVDDDMANLIVAQLLYLDSVDSKKDIVLYVNSPGGSVTAGMAIFDTMRHVRPDCATVCVGLAASMGAFLLASGHKGKRYSLPHSRIMIHQPLGGAQGQAADIEIQANEILHHKLTLNGYLAEFTGQSLEKITEDTDRDFFMSAAEAKEYGLIDEVILSPTAVSSLQCCPRMKELKAARSLSCTPQSKAFYLLGRGKASQTLPSSLAEFILQSCQKDVQHSIAGESGVADSVFFESDHKAIVDRQLWGDALFEAPTMLTSLLIKQLNQALHV
eukprot:scaffold662_cov364-Pavlova_lutheri.AAC.13